MKISLGVRAIIIILLAGGGRENVFIQSQCLVDWIQATFNLETLLT